MAESTNPQDGGKKKELSMETRLLLAFILMGAVLFLTPYFYRSQAPPRPPAKPAPAAVKKPESPAAPQEQAAAEKKKPASDKAAPAAPVAAQKEELLVIDTDVYRITFSNRGALARSWTLKKYKDRAKTRPLELINQAAAAKAGYPFQLVFKNRKPATNLNQALYSVKTAPDGLGLDFEFSDGKVLARKSFRFEKGSHRSQVTSEVVQNGVALPHLLAWRGGFGDMTVDNAAGSQHTVYFDAAEGLELNSAKAGKDGPVSVSGNFAFAGIEDAYFAAVFLPGNGSLELQTWSDSVPTEISKGAEQAFVGAAVGGEGLNRLTLFVGPKDLDLLRSVNPRLEQLVDFGWFAFLAKPLFLILRWMTENYIHNYGWSIVILTVLINFALFPLKITSMKSMKKMQGLQPQIAEINARYKNVGIRDPKKQQQNQEVMELYKKHGVNPMGGCVPILLQIPFFFAFYKVLSVTSELRGADWLWVSDLSRPEDLAIRILPLAMIVSQFIMQKMTPSTSPDPAQQRMMMMMPLIFGFMFWSASSGLVLYWLASNLVGIAQQLFFNHTSTAAAAVESVQTKKKQSRK
ncbi:MAG: membrane protein insertase YidC [Bryobacterales bacterium]|nr:membrane protein insertase YidC [Bryobacterales bacterium]